MGTKDAITIDVFTIDWLGISAKLYRKSVLDGDQEITNIVQNKVINHHNSYNDENHEYKHLNDADMYEL